MTDTARDIPTVEIGRLVRARLKKLWPRVKFSVRTSTYSMGSDVTVRWADGPTRALVEDAIGGYRGKGFDGAIDGSYHWTSWLHEGRATVAQDNPAPHPAAELVRFRGDGVTCTRDVSRQLAERALASLVRKGAPALGLTVEGDEDRAHIAASYHHLGTEQQRWEDAARQGLARFMIAG